MKNNLWMILLFSGLLLSCNRYHQSANKDVYKARFEVKAICSNYTFSVIEGDIPKDRVVPSWTNPQTGKTYINAFGVSNPCVIPQNLKEGDTFYFVIDSSGDKGDCMVCMAYYPTPEKKLSIKILK